MNADRTRLLLDVVVVGIVALAAVLIEFSGGEGAVNHGGSSWGGRRLFELAVALPVADEGLTGFCVSWS